jgi:hypothetical protein
VFSRVRSAVSSLQAAARELDPACLDGHDAAALVELAARGERICASIRALAARRVDETKVWRDEGHRSAQNWLAEKTGDTVGAAGRALDTARRLDALPETAAAFRAGELSEAQAHEITDAAGSDPGAERDLLDTARSSSMKGLRDRCREVRAGAEADDREWARRLHDRRRVRRWTDPDGSYRADVRLAPDAGARFDAALEAHVQRVFADARAAGRREPREAYAADALVALATEGPCKPVEIKLNVDSAPLVNGHARAGERCEIVGIGPVPVTIARKLVEDSLVSLIVREGTDVVAATRAARTIPAKLRRAVEARYPSCGVSGCANDRFLQIDHVQGLAEGGLTDEANLWRLCSHHHALKTYRGWKVIGTVHNWDLVPPDHPDPPWRSPPPPPPEPQPELAPVQLKESEP